MPTYRNQTANSIVYAQTTFLPGVDTAVDFFIPYVELGLTLVSSSPPVQSMILFSGTVANKTLTIPAASNITVSAVTPTSATLYLADDPSGVYITASNGYSITAPWQSIGRIRVEGEAQIVVEGR